MKPYNSKISTFTVFFYFLDSSTCIFVHADFFFSSKIILISRVSGYIIVEFNWSTNLYTQRSFLYFFETCCEKYK
jgi:hypothetical protein